MTTDNKAALKNLARSFGVRPTSTTLDQAKALAAQTGDPKKWMQVFFDRAYKAAKKS